MRERNLADDLVERWHSQPDTGERIWEFMRLSRAEYGRFVERNTLPADFMDRWA